MNIYLVPACQTDLTRKGRVQSQLHVRLDRDGQRQAKAFAQTLKSRHPTIIYCSDVHKETGDILHSELKIPLKILPELKPFHFGKHTSRKSEQVENVIQALMEQWEKNPDIPIRGGDSWTSFRKRYIAFIEKTLAMTGEVIVVTDLAGIRTARVREFKSLADDNSIQSKIYILSRKENHAATDQKAAPVERQAERSGPVVQYA
jgi:broad specificity phosphatase PhoE